MQTPFLLGVLGGMGPLATVDFLQKLIDGNVDAKSDADHVPLVAVSIPQIEPRVAAILSDGASPLPELVVARDRLLAAGATLLAMPCNTAHHWYEGLREGCEIPFLHIADTAIDACHERLAGKATIGIVATRGTLAAGIYSKRVADAGWTLLTSTEEEQRDEVDRGIREVKAGRVGDGGMQFAHAIEALRDRGAALVILACTEVPPGLAAAAPSVAAACVDATAALARACVRRWRAHRSPMLSSAFM